MKLQNKIPSYVVLIILIVGVLGSIAIFTVQKQASSHQFEDTAQAMSVTILNGLERDMLIQDRSHVQQTLDDLSQNDAISEIDIVTQDGRIWASTDVNAIDSTTSSDAVQALLSGNTAQDYVSKYMNGYMTLLTPIPAKDACIQCHGTIAAPPNANNYLGAVRVDISTAFLDNSVTRSQQVMLLVGGLIFVLVTGTIVLMLRRSILRPLSRLTRAATHITAGDYSTRVPVDSPDNEIGAVSVAFNDMVNKVEHHMEKLEDANLELEEANRMKSEFLANMSHELRTPLNVIIGFSEVLRDTPPEQFENDDRQEFFENIVSSGYHLLELINDVLDLAKVEAGQMDIVPEDFYVGTALREVVATLQPLAAKKNLEMEASVSDRLTSIYADAAKFKQILYNLVGNAIKFTREGGKINISASVMGDMARFAVADTGIGVALEDQQRIFSEFQQADGSAARQYEGTGLGLALTKKFVDMQGGNIWMESELGVGSTFFFTLPLPSKTKKLTAAPVDKDVSLTGAKTGAADRPADEPSRNAPGILVVEDDRATADLIGVWLTNEGYQVEFAANGIEAVDKARKSHPFAICLDIMLPKRDGWQVLHDLKTDPETADVGVIVCSALDNQELGFALGAADYCIKPLSRKHLLDKLRKLQQSTRGNRAQPQVLIADGDPEAARVTASVLERQGYGVVTTYDGQSLIDKALELNPDIIILDLMLPKVNCFDTVSSLRHHPLTVDTPIIVTAANNLNDDEKEFLDMNVQQIVTKGGNKEMLLGEIFRLEKLNPERARLIDEETGLFNRRYFRKRLVEEVRRSDRYSLSMSTVLVSLRFSDGAPMTGSAMIKKAVGAMRGNIRAVDPIARYDHNRFAVLLPETRREAGMVVANKVVTCLHATDFSDKSGKDIEVIVSAVVTESPNGLVPAEQMLAKLELALKNLEEDGNSAVRSIM